MKPNCTPTRVECQPQRKSTLNTSSPLSAVNINENTTTENINASLITTTFVVKRKRMSLAQETETTINKDWVEIPSSSHEPDGSREKIIPNNVQKSAISLSCRTIRIGSYKFTTKEKVYISANGIKIVAPLIKNKTTDVPLLIQSKEMCRVLVHFDKARPVIFLYTMFKCARYVRTALGMVENSGPFYDPFSKLHAFKVITLLPEAISDEAEVVLKALFGQMMDELDHRKANDILRRIGEGGARLGSEIIQNDLLQTRSGRSKNKYDDSDQHRKSLPAIEVLNDEDVIPEDVPDELMNLKKQKMEVELALAKEQLQIAKRERYKLDLEIFKSENELNISPSNFTTHLYHLQNDTLFLNGVTVKEE